LITLKNRFFLEQRIDESGPFPLEFSLKRSPNWGVINQDIYPSGVLFIIRNLELREFKDWENCSHFGHLRRNLE
jgi:hypothetical protein